MNSVIYIVGLLVVVLAVLAFTVRVTDTAAMPALWRKRAPPPGRTRNASIPRKPLRKTWASSKAAK